MHTSSACAGAVRRTRHADCTDGWPRRSLHGSAVHAKFGHSNRSAPLTQDLDGAAEIALRTGPVEWYPLAGNLLKRFGEGGHGLLKSLCPALPRTQGRKDVAEIVLRTGPVEWHPLAGNLLERFGEGGHGLLKSLCPALPRTQGRKDVAEIVLRTGPVEGHPLAGNLLERLGERRRDYSAYRPS